MFLKSKEVFKEKKGQRVTFWGLSVSNALDGLKVKKVELYYWVSFKNIYEVFPIKLRTEN